MYVKSIGLRKKGYWMHLTNMITMKRCNFPWLYISITNITKSFIYNGHFDEPRTVGTFSMV